MSGRHHAPEGSERNQDGDWPGSIYQDHIWAMLAQYGIEPDGAHYRYHEPRHALLGVGKHAEDALTIVVSDGSPN